MKHISCIIFDLDGTLTQTNELIFATFNHVARKYTDRTYTPQEIVAMFGPPEEVAVENIVGKDRVDEAMDDFLGFYGEHHPRMASAYEGIREMLEFLKNRGILLAIFTGKGKRTALITLEKIGIKSYFDIVVTGSDVRNHKPSAEGIRKVMERFGLEPNQVLMVGDAVSDVRAAHEAGVHIAAVLWDSYGKENVLKMDVDYFFHSVAEFVGWLESAVPSNGASR
ncbi:MAG: HAD family hydrolase [Ignavibacteria bacterium]|nr:HAD family hydrolase [Ignavibacteria bacterium]